MTPTPLGTSWSVSPWYACQDAGRDDDSVGVRSFALKPHE